MVLTKVLLVGATGYMCILLYCRKIYLKKCSFSVLVRRGHQAKFFESKSINSIVFRDLGDSEALQRAASEYDVVINSALASHTGAAKALILGLGYSKKRTGKQTYYFHTPGTSNLSDRYASGPYTEACYTSDTPFSDKDDDIYSYEKMRNEKEAYPQRITDTVVVEKGLQSGVQTYIIMSPLIYGQGTGSFNKISIQIPVLTQGALKIGQAFVLGDGKAIWNYVHIADLIHLYELLLLKVLSGQHLPFGEKGIYFTETGQFSWMELSEGIARAGKQLGARESKEVKHVNLEDFWRLTGFPITFLELAFAGNSRTKSDFARELGWKPHCTAQDFQNSFVEVFKAVVEEKKVT